MFLQIRVTVNVIDLTTLSCAHKKCKVSRKMQMKTHLCNVTYPKFKFILIICVLAL